MAFSPGCISAFSLEAAEPTDPTFGKSAKRVKLTKNDLDNTPQGRQFLKYLISCALPEEVELYTTVDGQEVTFYGSLGLAPEWIDKGLTPNQQRWVSACILARTNYFGTSVQISMRAVNSTLPGLQATEKEKEKFSLYEGAFYGNLFQKNAKAYACVGSRTPPETQASVLKVRVCTEPTDILSSSGQPVSRCGFILQGPCSPDLIQQVNNQTYHEVIAVYLHPKFPLAASSDISTGNN